MPKPTKRRKPCPNCGELIHDIDEHYVDAERVGCWWQCSSVAEVRKAIKAKREQAAHLLDEADRLSRRRAIRLGKGGPDGT